MDEHGIFQCQFNLHGKPHFFQTNFRDMNGQTSLLSTDVKHPNINITHTTVSRTLKSQIQHSTEDSLSLYIYVYVVTFIQSYIVHMYIYIQSYHVVYIFHECWKCSYNRSKWMMTFGVPRHVASPQAAAQSCWGSCPAVRPRSARRVCRCPVTAPRTTAASSSSRTGWVDGDLWRFMEMHSMYID